MILTSFLRILLIRSFKPFIFTNAYHLPLSYEDEQDLGLYVHIPFCRSLCPFCPYCKFLYKRELAERYKEALLKEIEMVGSRQKKKKEVTSLYFGGGTPALMKEFLKEIIDFLERYFIIRQDIGVELHPDDIDEPTLDLLKAAGITMVSLGIQSFNHECLAAIGRQNADFEAKLKLVTKAGFKVIDVDLIFALPKQTEEILLTDLKKAFDLGASQISTYPFIDFTFASNVYRPLSEKEKRKMLHSICTYCERTGKERTAVWTFAQKGTGRYSSVTRDNFLGFGVSAATLLSSQFKINTFSLEAYLARINKEQLPTALSLDFTPRQRAVYYLFWNAYSLKISEAKFERLLGKPLNKMYGLELELAKKMGFLKKVNNEYLLTERGAYYYHFLEQAYTTAYIDKMWNVLSKEAFPNELILK